MPAFVKINDFVEDLVNGVHNFSSDTFRLALSNTDPAAEASNPTADGNGVLANVTQIAYTNLPGAVAPTLDNVSAVLASGTLTFDADDEAITASGGAANPFRYVYLYNDTAANDPLIGYWDYGSSLTLADGESLTVVFAGAGILTIA